MSFEKARNIIDLYINLAGRHVGLTINDVINQYGISRRTAQRMLHLAEDMFHAETYKDAEGRKRWLVKENIRKELIDITAEEMAALELARNLLERRGQKNAAKHLIKLGNKIKALIPSKKTVSLEIDYEALLEAQGFAARRGPRPLINRTILSVVGEAIKGCELLDIDHAGEEGKINHYSVAPYGILYGKRPYLVGHFAGDTITQMRYFRLDKIHHAKLTGEYFIHDENFDLTAFSRKSYSIFQNEAEFGEVVWKFSPEAAVEARLFLFHPDQKFTDEEDGSLTVSFEASGHLEMCWDLYRWGDQVEVIKPLKLKKMCENYRRSDFPSLP